MEVRREMRTIYTCAGIGDSIWILQKLINQSEKFNWVLPGGNPRRGKQVFDLLPQITESCVYSDRSMKVRDIVKQSERGNWSSIKKQSFYLECNSHLEAGKRIEDWLPDLQTSYTLPWATTLDHELKANLYLTISGEIKGNELTVTHNMNPKPYIGLYGSSYSTSRSWGFWQADKWAELAARIGKEFTYVVLGAEWDKDLAGDLIPRLKSYGLDVINTVGQPLSVVIEIMKRLHAFIGFPSGLSILNETLAARQTVMFYPPHLIKMMNTWADPARIESGAYKGCQFCSPETIYNWLKDRL